MCSKSGKPLCHSRKMLCMALVLALVIGSMVLSTLPAQVLAAVTTWHVSTSGNDDNSGTSEVEAFRTINKAARTANAGDTVLIYGGTYRETVKPLRGGGSESTRITYRSDDGEPVTVKGSEVLTGWSVYSGNVYQASMSEINFNGYNPYTIALVGMTNRTLGQVFSNGTELDEADDVLSVGITPNSWKASADGLIMYVNLNGANPNSNSVEVAVRKQVFAPSVYNLGYITVKGINFEHGANQYPDYFWTVTGSQEGIVSVNGGHDFIIENCGIRYAKTVALDIGYSGGRNFNDSGMNIYGDNISGQKEAALIYSVVGRLGHNIVRNNAITDIGSIGIIASHADCSIIENNKLIRINTLQIGGLESGGIKTHWFIDGVIKDNYIKDVYGNNANSIWLDNVYQGARVSGNVIVASYTTYPVQFEMSAGPVLFDNNVIIGGNGIYGKSGEGYVAAHNLFFDMNNYSPWSSKRFMSVQYTPNNPDFTGGTFDGSLDAKSSHLRYFNNIFIKKGLNLGADTSYKYDNLADYNLYYEGATKDPARDENSIQPVYACNFDYTADDNGVSVNFSVNSAPWDIAAPVINGSYTGPDKFTGGTIGNVERDYLGNTMAATDPVIGPFADLTNGYNSYMLWPKTTTPKNYTRPVENLIDDKTDIIYVGDGWTESSNTENGRLGGKIHYTAYTGDFFEYSFYGTGIDYIAEKDSDRGDVDIYIDGTFQQTVSCYDGTFQCQYKAYSIKDLAKGWHTIKGVKKSGTFMMVDALNIYNYVNDDNAGIIYSGSWNDSNGRGLGDYGDDLHYTTVNNNYAQYTFWGKGIEYISEKNYDLGDVDIYIDDIFMQTVNAYTASPRQSQQVLFSKCDLDYKKHTIKVVKKSGIYLCVDAFNINQPTSPLAIVDIPSDMMYNDDVPTATYSGSWTDSNNRGLGEYNDDVHYTLTNNDYFEFAFTGTGIEYLSDKGLGLGDVDIYIDDNYMETVSAYSSGSIIPQQIIFSKYDLPYGGHKIKGVKKSGTWMLTDAFKVISKNKCNDDDTGISYSSGWVDSNDRIYGDYNDDVHYTADSGAYATFSFTGTGICYITEKGDDRGNVKVYIDNVLQTTVNCYNPTLLVQQTVFTKTDLTPGNHTIKIENADEGKYMALDAFTVLRFPVILNDDSPVFTYSANWSYSNGRSQLESGLFDYMDDVHYCTGNNSYVDISFSGSAVEIVSEKFPTYGEADVYIDGIFKETISFYNDGAGLVQQKVYACNFGSYGDHTVRLVKKSGVYMTIDAVKVYPHSPY